MLVIAKLEVYIRDTKEYEANYISLRYLLYNVQVFFYLGCDSFTSENTVERKRKSLICISHVFTITIYIHFTSLFSYICIYAYAIYAFQRFRSDFYFCYFMRK